MKKHLLLLLLCILSLSLLTACGPAESDPEPEVKLPELEQLRTPKQGDNILVIETSLGTIKALLFTSESPENVKNITTLASGGYYDSCIFHKTISDFCIQTGDPTKKGNGGESSTGSGIALELSETLQPFTGAVCMVPGDDGLNHSQFLFVLGSEPDSTTVTAMTNAGFSGDVISAYKALGGQPTFYLRYTIIGQVFDGLDVIKEIAESETDDYNRPVNDIEILSVTTAKYGSESREG